MNELKQILHEQKTPDRIFEKLGRQSNDTLRLIAVCIARQISKFSSHESILSDILNQFESYPQKTLIIDLLMCKRRLTKLGNIRHTAKRDSDWSYWQAKTDQACIFAFNNLLEIVKSESSVRNYYLRFIEQASLTYGFAEAMRQMKNVQNQRYEFDANVDSKILETQKHNTLRAHRSHISGQRVAKVEFLKILKEKLK